MPSPALRRTVREHGLGYVLQVAANRPVPTHAGPMRVDQLPAILHGWQKLSAGAGSKGERYYSWAWIALLPEDGVEHDHTGQHHPGGSIHS